MIKDSILLISFSDLFVNLSAGWFGAAFIIPIKIRSRKKRIEALLLNMTFGIVYLALAIVLRSSI